MTEQKRDYSFEAMCEVTGADAKALTKDERGRINAALKQLRVLIPDDYVLAATIHDRAADYRVAYPEIALTPQALTGAWSSIEQKAADTRRLQTKQVNAPPIPRAGGVCETCDGDRMVFMGTRDGHDQYSPCPDCNSSADVDFWRADGSRFRSPDAALIRERMNS